jgi:hypothetical protein
VRARALRADGDDGALGRAAARGQFAFDEFLDGFRGELLPRTRRRPAGEISAARIAPTAARSAAMAARWDFARQAISRGDLSARCGNAGAAVSSTRTAAAFDERAQGPAGRNGRRHGAHAEALRERQQLFA